MPLPPLASVGHSCSGSTPGGSSTFSASLGSGGGGSDCRVPLDPQGTHTACAASLWRSMSAVGERETRRAERPRQGAPDRPQLPVAGLRYGALSTAAAAASVSRSTPFIIGARSVQSVPFSSARVFAARRAATTAGASSSSSESSGTSNSLSSDSLASASLSGKAQEGPAAAATAPGREGTRRGVR